MSVEPVAITIGTEILNGLSAIGAHEDAIGGAALAAGAAIKGTSWLVSALKTRLPFFNRHYLGTTPAAQTQAAANVISVSQHIRNRFDEYVADGRLTEQQARDALDSPAFALFFNDAVLGASETDDDFIHEQFASLIVERLATDSASASAIAIRIATERLHDVTSQQLRLLGAIYVSQYIIPDQFLRLTDSESDFARYADLCQEEVSPHRDASLDTQDFLSLASANLLTIRDDQIVQSRGLRFPMLQIADPKFPGRLAASSFRVFATLSLWKDGAFPGSVSFNSIFPSQSGWILGNAVHANLRDRRLDLSNLVV